MNKELDNGLFIIGLVIMAIVLLFVSNAFAGVETVKDNNDGNAGYILVNTGCKNGQSDIGHWTDPNFLKGDTGATGLQGIKGDKGDAGQNGIDGLDGKNGLNGKDGLDGAEGEQGIAGKDIDPQTVIDLQNTDNILQDNIDIEQFDRTQLGNTLQANINNEAVIRANTDTTLNNKIVDTNNKVDNLEHRVGKLEATQYKIQTEFRIYDDKHITISPYISNNINRHKLDEVGVRITVKLGASYEEKEIAKTNARLSTIEKKIGMTAVIEKVIDTKGNLKSIHINSNGLSINGGF